jgi:hypothetical protein
MDPRLAVVLLGGLLIVSGLVWIGWIEVSKRIAETKDVPAPNWQAVVMYLLQHLAPEYLVPLTLIAIGAAMAVGGVWTAPAAAGGAATASPTPK